MRLKAPDNRLYLGRGGSGKSYLARHQSRQFKRVLFHDPTHDPDNQKGAVLCADRAYLVELVARPGAIRICWRGPSQDRTADFEFANRCALAGEDFLVIWDELDLFHVGGGRLPEWAYSLLHIGRHHGCRVWATSRRPFSVPVDLRALATRMLCFKTVEPRDLKFLEQRMGAEVAKLPGLEPRHCLDWTEAASEIRKSPFK